MREMEEHLREMGERLRPESSEAFIYVAMSRLMVSRVSDARGISVRARAKRGKMAIMRQNVEHG